VKTKLDKFIRLAGLALVFCMLGGIAESQPESRSRFQIEQPEVELNPDVEQAYAFVEAGSYSSAIQLLVPQANAGDAVAQAMLAELYSQGLGVPQNFATAVALNTAAASQGNYSAQNALGRSYIDGIGVARDTQLGLALLEQAARSGRPDYQTDFGSALETSTDAPEQWARAAGWYRRAADQGFVPAMTSLGVLYLEGKGVERDGANAIELFSQAAEEGDARAQNNLGLIYVRGEDTERDYDQAAILFQLAADQGLREGLTNLSVMYESGFGVELDEAEARRLLAQARLVGSFTLSATLDEIGFPFDTRLLQPDWLAVLDASEERAALAGDPIALYRTAFRYLNGDGVRQNIPLAITRLEQSAMQGMNGAQLNLGILYARGEALPQNYGEAYLWISLAAYHGNIAAERLRDVLATEMSAEQLTRTQERVLTILSGTTQ
jgi:TPR repeat protein